MTKHIPTKGASISFSKETPTTHDQAGYEALDWVEFPCVSSMSDEKPEKSKPQTIPEALDELGREWKGLKSTVRKEIKRLFD